MRRDARARKQNGKPELPDALLQVLPLSIASVAHSACSKVASQPARPRVTRWSSDGWIQSL